MNPMDYITAARVPKTLLPQKFGLWEIERIPADGQIVHPRQKAMHEQMVGFPDYTLLRHYVFGCELGAPADIVMEDSIVELSKHLPIWMAARGRVLVNGLGLGCVVRGLLVNPAVSRIDVVEIDRDILRIIGAEFEGDPRVWLHHGDAMTIRWAPGTRFNFAWHDLWKDGDGLQLMHAKLFFRYRRQVSRQGAWAFPRSFARMMALKHGFDLLGAPKQSRRA